MLREGAVQKWKDPDGVWKPRHLELTAGPAGPLLTYRAKKGKRELGALEVANVYESEDGPFVFEVTGATGDERAKFAAAKQADAEGWLAAIRGHLQPAPATPPPLPAASRPPPPADRVFVRFDRDGDGLLNADEMRAAAAEVCPTEPWDDSLWPESCAEFGVDPRRGFDPPAFSAFQDAMGSLSVDDEQVAAPEPESEPELEPEPEPPATNVGAIAEIPAFKPIGSAFSVDDEDGDEDGTHSSTDSDHGEPPPRSPRKVDFGASADAAPERKPTGASKPMKPVPPLASMLTSFDGSEPTVRNETSPVPPLALDLTTTTESSTGDEEEIEEDMGGADSLDGTERASPEKSVPEVMAAAPAASAAKPAAVKPAASPFGMMGGGGGGKSSGGSPAFLGVLRMAQAKQKVEEVQVGAEEKLGNPQTPQRDRLSLELVMPGDGRPPTTPPQLMTGTPRTPRGTIPYETELLREQLEEQMQISGALRQQLEETSAEAGVKQLRENWLQAEDRADQQRARLTEVCIQQVPGLKRELAARNSENSVLTTQVDELLEELHEATSLGHQLIMASPRQQDINSLQKRIEDELEAKKHISSHAAQQLHERDGELQELRVKLASGDQEREELRARVTQVCAQHLPELKQQLAEKDRTLEALEGEKDELRTRATQLITVYLPDLKGKLNAREQEIEGLLQQVEELQSGLEEKKELHALNETHEAEKAEIAEEMQGMTEERRQLVDQAAHLRGKLERLESARSAADAKSNRLMAAIESLEDQNAGLAEEASANASALTQEHTDEAVRRNQKAADEVEQLQERWRSDVAARDARIAKMERITADLQGMLTESNIRSETVEAQAQELAAESDEMLAALKSAQRSAIQKMQTELEDSAMSRQVLEERLGSGDSEATMLRAALEETRRQLELAVWEKAEQDSSWALRQKEHDAKSERETRRTAALQRRVETLQQELLDLGKSTAESGSGQSSVIKVSQQLTWYSQQLEASQNNARRLQREVDRLTRENLQLAEQQGSTREQLAQHLRSTSASSNTSGEGGGASPVSTNLQQISAKLSETVAELYSSRELASARAADLDKLRYAWQTHSSPFSIWTAGSDVLIVFMWSGFSMSRRLLRWQRISLSRRAVWL